MSRKKLSFAALGVSVGCAVLIAPFAGLGSPPANAVVAIDAEAINAEAIEDWVETPPENPLQTSETQPMTLAAAEYLVGGLNTACSVGGDPSGIVSVVSTSGLLDVTFDLSRVPDTENAVRIYSDIARDCKNTVGSVTFLGSSNITEMTVERYAFQQNLNGNNLVSVIFPDGIESLDVGDQAFYQYSRNFDNTLEEIRFPDTLKSLRIGSGAFSQGGEWGARGNNALTRVDFPEGLETLHIEKHAFYQISGNSDEDYNTLAEINFPSTLKDLEIGYRAFSQWSVGGPNALERVYFPDGLERLIVGQDAFYQSQADDNKLRRVSIPAGLQELEIGLTAFYSNSLPVLLEFRTGQLPGDGADSVTLGPWILASNGQLFWYGKSAQTSQLWEANLAAGSTDYPIAGYRRLNLGLDGGQLSDFNGSESRFAYPDGEGGVSSWSGIADYTGVSPAWPFPEHRLILPEPTKPDHTFLGWCATPPADGVCRDASGAAVPLLNAGIEYRPVATGDNFEQLYAVWLADPSGEVVPPVKPVTPGPTDPGPDRLAATGAPAWGPALAISLLAAGALLVLIRRRTA